MENNIIEEVFCLNYELKALSDILIRGEAERWIPNYMLLNIEDEHLERYKLAIKYVENKRVLDIACGCGYGTFLLADKGSAKEVLGCDIDENSIRYANHRFPHPNVKRSKGNAEKFDVEIPYDVIVSYETIEHLRNYEDFLVNVKKALVEGGIFFVSTPIVQNTRTNCGNPYHVIEWSFNDFHKLISQYFHIEDIYVQSIELFEPKPSVSSRLYKKIRRQFISENQKSKYINTKLEKYSDQYNPDKIIHGYQVLKAINKT